MKMAISINLISSSSSKGKINNITIYRSNKLNRTFLCVIFRQQAISQYRG